MTPVAVAPASSPRVLFIGGTGRTGSTVLDALLGAHPGVFAGGELAFFWRFGLQHGGRCSCGRPIRSCPVWAEVLATAFGTTGLDADRMVRLRRRFWSVHLPLMVSRNARRRGLERLEEFPTVVEQLYRAIMVTTGDQLIVDSSKEPHYSYILREATALDPYFLHLVRDPRAVGRSWQRRRAEPGLGGATTMERRGAARASIYYDVSNTAAELLWAQSDRYAFLRYEDFVARPAETVRAIGRFVGFELEPDGVLDTDNGFERRALHSAWGNPNRFERTRTTLRSDDAWKRELSHPSAAALTAMTGPLMLRYGYGRGGRLRPPHGRPKHRRLAA